MPSCPNLTLLMWRWCHTGALDCRLLLGFVHHTTALAGEHQLKEQEPGEGGRPGWSRAGGRAEASALMCAAPAPLYI